MKKTKEQKTESTDLCLFIDGQEVLSGDETSIRVVFGNLTGRNFSNRADPKLEFGQWLTMMEYDWQRPLTACLPIVVRRCADNCLVLSGYIGEGMTRQDPEPGQPCLVRIYPFGADPLWIPVKMAHRQDETLVSRELFYFSAAGCSYPVTREELYQRVWPMGANVVTISIASAEARLWPVPMNSMPSGDPESWLRFVKGHVPKGELSGSDQNAIQRFMKAQQTEALTDGIRCFTLAGGLAYCDPSLGTPAEVVPLA